MKCVLCGEERTTNPPKPCDVCEQITQFVHCRSCGIVTEVDDEATELSKYCSKCLEIQRLEKLVKELRAEKEWYCKKCRTVHPFGSTSKSGGLMDLLRCPTKDCDGILCTKYQFKLGESDAMIKAMMNAAAKQGYKFERGEDELEMKKVPSMGGKRV